MKRVNLHVSGKNQWNHSQENMFTTEARTAYIKMAKLYQKHELKNQN